jgi:hypothetical protein
MGLKRFRDLYRFNKELLNLQAFLEWVSPRPCQLAIHGRGVGPENFV